MNIGARLEAPQGFQGLKSGEAYYYLHSGQNGARVRLVLFIEEKTFIKTHVFSLARVDFEAALENGELLELKSGESYPFWLEGVWGKELAFLEKQRGVKSKTLAEVIDLRYLAISELVENWEAIVACDSPDTLINLHARKSTPQQNETRLKLWFYSYIVFGRNKLALLPRLHRIGGWDRESKSKKLGRPSGGNPKSGFPATPEMKASILKGYVDNKKSGMSWLTLYGEVMTNEFKCKTIKRNGTFEFVNLDGKPFPSFHQFKYWLKKNSQARSVSLEMLGKKRTRAKTGSIGSFSEKLVNVSQVAEFDGYYIIESPSGVLEQSAQEPFCVVRAICGLSGMLMGVGFSDGKENMAAYQMALFSMAVDKVKFCELFGIVIEDSEWPCVGLPGNVVFDRGPGAHLNVEAEVNWLGQFELPPSHDGQGKATIESSHPREKKVADVPGFVHSAHNFVELSKREIMQVLIDNKTSDASGRMTEEMIYAHFKPTPENIWIYLDDRGRNSSSSMPFDDAVRQFLVKHSATIKDSGVYLHGRKYNSPELVTEGVYDFVARNGSIPVEVYVLTMCVRHIWLDYQGDLIELSAVIRSSDAPGAQDISIYELQKLNKIRLDGLNDLHKSIPAVQQEYRTRFKDNVGKEWSAGKRISGAKQKDMATKRDLQDQAAFRGKAK